MKRFFKTNLISAFLLLFAVLPLSTYAEEGIVYWVNPDGGRYYHLDQNCRVVHPKYLPLPVSMTKEELEQPENSFYLPCSICVDERRGICSGRDKRNRNANRRAGLGNDH